MNPRRGLLEELKKFAAIRDNHKKIVTIIFNQLIEHYEVYSSDEGKAHAKTIQLLIEDNNFTYPDIEKLMGCSESKLKSDIKKYNITTKNIIIKLIENNSRYHILKKIIK